MELKQLEYFMAICEEMHFTKTADKLGIGQPTLSYQIKALEDELGVRLFDRLGRRIALTEAGEILLEHCHKIFDNIKSATDHLQELQTLNRGRLTIGALSGDLSQIASRALVEFHSMYPHIHLQFYALDDVLKKVKQNELDLALTILPPEDEQLKIIPLYEEEFYLVVHAEHVLANQNEAELKDIQNIPLILNPKDHYFRHWFDIVCAKQGILLDPIIESTDTKAIICLVKEGKGATILSSTLFNLENNGQLRAIRIKPSLIRTIALVHHKQKHIGTSANIFKNLLYSCLETYSRGKSDCTTTSKEKVPTVI
ncbi:LysR family transcriptional regulator [Sutcliffiella halmapala]|uniref:LysR family transcriptional regulator n=1 Tax=Sutcliffiella halmapala TaxID=79882 RepID=UPI0014746DE1|nr:LysR family transcriptional regulator [Sutcliffiella halmapala]